MAVDFTTCIGAIRALINDVDEENFEFEDEQLEMFYHLSYCNIAQASIMALRALVSKYSATGGDSYRVDTLEYEEGKSKASNYQSLLNNLEQSIKDGTNPLCFGVPKVFGVYTKDRQENIQRMIDGEIIPPKTFDKEYDLVKLKTQYGVYYETGE